MTNKYMKRSQHEEASKSTSYLGKNLKEHKHGILSESKNFMVLKYQTGYLQAQTSSEMKRILEHLGSKVHDRWFTIAEKYFVQFNSSINLWN